MNATYAVRAPEPELQTVAAMIAAITGLSAATGLPAATKSTMSTCVIDAVSEIAPAELPAATDVAVDGQPRGPLKEASISRLACLFRHWTWANEAMVQFERELAAGLDYDDNPLADHPFGAYYRWCALLSDLQWESLRVDLEASLPGLRACRQLLVVIPASFEEHPRIVDLLHDHETLERLRRIHSAFGDALRQEQRSRELEWLLYEH